MKVINTYCPVWYHYGSDHEGGTSPMFVMTVDSVGQFACYAGLANLPKPDAPNYMEVRLRAADFIAANGSKLTLKQALGFFSGIDEENYRH